HQTRYSRPATGIFRITARKKMGQNPSTASGSVTRPHPPEQSVHVILRQATIRLGRHEQGGGRAPDGPCLTGLVDAVVHPRERPIACVAVDCRDLPVSG